MFVVEIWVFWNRAVSCCEEIRSILGQGLEPSVCPADPATPCRGFTGDCADLAQQFASVVPELDAFVCRAFPDPESPWHQAVVGAIMIAVRALRPLTCFHFSDQAAPRRRVKTVEGACLCFVSRACAHVLIAPESCASWFHVDAVGNIKSKTRTQTHTATHAQIESDSSNSEPRKYA